MAVPSARAPWSRSAPRAPWAEWLGGIVGTLAVVAVPLSLGLLAFAPLGVQASQVALSAAAVTTVLGGLVYAVLGPILFRLRSGVPSPHPSGLQRVRTMARTRKALPARAPLRI